MNDRNIKENNVELKKLSYTKDFERDLKKLKAKHILSPEFTEVMHCLQRRISLPSKYKDHSLSGNMKGFRDCHIFNDLVLIYRYKEDTLELIRVNTHSEIYG